MAIELSTAGITVKYAVETTAGTRPTTGFSSIRGIKSIPEIGGEPNTIDVTPLSETGYHRQIPALKDTGGPVGLTVNDYDDFRTDWAALLTAQAALTDGKALWIEINVPGMAAASKPSFYFTAIASDLGFGGADVDGVYENIAYLTQNTVHGWDSASA